MVRFSQLLLFVLLCTQVAGCKNAENYAREGVKHLDKGEDVTALYFFEKALQADEDYALALYGKGRLLLQNKITKNDGKAMVERALPRLENPAIKEKAYLIIAEFYNKEANTSKAIEYLENALKEKIISPKTLGKLALYYSKAGDNKKALELLGRSTKEFAQDPSAHADMGRFYFEELKNFELARQSYLKSHQLQSGQKEILYKLMRSSYLVKKPAQSLQYLDMLLKLSIDPVETAQLQSLKPLIEKNQWKLN